MKSSSVPSSRNLGLQKNNPLLHITEKKVATVLLFGGPFVHSMYDIDWHIP